MTREIKFRGKRVDNGEWVEGYYYYDKFLKIHWIGFDNEWCEVIPETVSQFTGLKDKNGKEICEGDICIVGKHIEVVEYSSGQYNIGGWAINFRLNLTEVIGNIFDNKNLIEN